MRHTSFRRGWACWMVALLGSGAAAQPPAPPTDAAPGASIYRNPPEGGSDAGDPRGIPERTARAAPGSFSAAPAGGSAGAPPAGGVFAPSASNAFGPGGAAKNDAPMRPLRTAAVDRMRDAVVPRPNSPERGDSVARGPSELPNSAGQVWREYDITAYTRKVTNTERPEADVLEWIRHETGVHAWQGNVAALLTADSRAVRVYHTPEMQAKVAEIIERFTARPPDEVQFSVHILGVGRPDWRIRAQQVLKPIPTETPGSQAWLLRREDAALLSSELVRRGDAREFSSPTVRVRHGQAFVSSQMRPRTFVQAYAPRPDAWNVLEPQQGRIDEGMTMEFSPLLSLDGKYVDAHFQCEIRQVEKMHPVMIEGVAAGGQRQRLQIETPQLSEARLEERLRWNSEDVILVSMGVVPTPAPTGPKPLFDLSGAPNRAELLFLFSAVRNNPAAGPAPASAAVPPANGGRY